ncbi:Pectinacetylesterase family protein, partial [Perilla frutescens var. hirtella]
MPSPSSVMATRCFFSCALLLVNIAHCSLGPDNVQFTPVSNAIKRRAVCIDGSPAGYHYASGSGVGAKNWLGGGWCSDISDCQYKRTIYLGSSSGITTANLTGMLSKRQDVNPDFYNWNRIYVYYCDQSSFLGDTEIVDQGPNLQFRGSRIFDAVIEDLLEKGMDNADNAMLAGRSAGALAAILHCDGFRARLPNVARVKCFSDSGVFIR